MKRVIQLAAAATLALGLSACGSSDKSSSVSTAAQPAPRPADKLTAHKIPLGSTTEVVVAKLGPPKDIEVTRQPRRKTKKGPITMVPVADYYYDLKGGKAGDLVDFSFYRGKLSSVLIRSHK
jgi:hypothetical protein